MMPRKLILLFFTVITGLFSGWLMTEAQTWKMSASPPPDNSSLQAVIPVAGDDLGNSDPHMASKNLDLTGHRIYGIKTTDNNHGLTISSGANGANLFAQSDYAIYAQSATAAETIYTTAANYGLIAQTGLFIAAYLEGNLKVAGNVQLGSEPERILTVGTAGAVNAGAKLYFENKLLCDNALPNCGWAAPGATGDGLGNHLADTSVDMTGHKITAVASSGTEPGLQATSTNKAITSEFYSLSNHAIQATSNGIDANNSAGLYAYALNNGTGIGAASVLGYGAKFVGDLYLKNDAISGAKARLQFDYGSNDILNIDAAGLAEPSRNLYWGDKLLCDSTKVNCGWEEAATLGLWTANANGINFPDSGTAKVLFSDTRSSARLSVGSNYVTATETVTNYRLSVLNMASNTVNDVDVVGRIVFLATSDGLTIVNASDPDTPAILSNVSGFQAWDVDVVGDNAYVASMTGLQIVDVSNPRVPVLTKTYTYPDTPQPNPAGLYMTGLEINGRYTYIYYYYLNGGLYRAKLVTINIADPSNPILTNSQEMTATSDARDIDLLSEPSAGRLVIATSAEGLRLYDVSSNPAVPAFLNSTAAGDGQPVTAVTLVKDIASGNIFAYTVSGRLNIYNISSGSFVQSGFGGSSLTGATDVVVAGRYAYIAKNAASLSVYDVGNPASPVVVLKNHFTGASGGTYTNIVKIFLAGRYLYLVDRIQDLAIAFNQGLVAPAAYASSLSVADFNILNNLYVGSGGLTAGALTAGESGLHIDGQAILPAGDSLILGGLPLTRLDIENLKYEAGL